MARLEGNIENLEPMRNYLFRGRFLNSVEGSSSILDSTISETSMRELNLSIYSVRVPSLDSAKGEVVKYGSFTMNFPFYGSETGILEVEFYESDSMLIYETFTALQYMHRWSAASSAYGIPDCTFQLEVFRPGTRYFTDPPLAKFTFNLLVRAVEPENFSKSSDTKLTRTKVRFQLKLVKDMESVNSDIDPNKELTDHGGKADSIETLPGVFENNEMFFEQLKLLGLSDAEKKKLEEDYNNEHRENVTSTEDLDVPTTLTSADGTTRFVGRKVVTKNGYKVLVGHGEYLNPNTGAWESRNWKDPDTQTEQQTNSSGKLVAADGKANETKGIVFHQPASFDDGTDINTAIYDVAKNGVAALELKVGSEYDAILDESYFDRGETAANGGKVIGENGKAISLSNSLAIETMGSVGVFYDVKGWYYARVNTGVNGVVYRKLQQSEVAVIKERLTELTSSDYEGAMGKTLEKNVNSNLNTAKTAVGTDGTVLNEKVQFVKAYSVTPKKTETMVMNAIGYAAAVSGAKIADDVVGATHGMVDSKSGKIEGSSSRANLLLGYFKTGYLEGKIQK